jgi:hypothetical protein
MDRVRPRPPPRWVALLLLLLAACQPLPQPFAEDRPPTGAAILTPKDGAGIAVQPVAGVSAEVASGLAEAMAAALRDADVPASTQGGNKASYRLAGAARAQALAGGRTAIELRWELRGPDGAAAGAPVQKDEASLAEWRDGNPGLLARLAKAAAPRIAALLQEDGAADAGAGEIGVVVREVAGAPGDGPRALARAMVASLRQARIAATDGAAKPESGAKPFVVAGTVAMATLGAGKEKISVSWALLDPGGAQIGQVSQENAIPAGSLDGRWGDTAYAVANAAAGGIVALIEHLKAVRAGS